MSQNTKILKSPLIKTWNYGFIQNCEWHFLYRCGNFQVKSGCYTDNNVTHFQPSRKDIMTAWSNLLIMRTFFYTQKCPYYSPWKMCFVEEQNTICKIKLIHEEFKEGKGLLSSSTLKKSYVPVSSTDYVTMILFLNLWYFMSFKKAN